MSATRSRGGTIMSRKISLPTPRLPLTRGPSRTRLRTPRLSHHCMLAFREPTLAIRPRHCKQPSAPTRPRCKMATWGTAVRRSQPSRDNVRVTLDSPRANEITNASIHSSVSSSSLSSSRMTKAISSRLRIQKSLRFSRDLNTFWSAEPSFASNHALQ
jgi:hypothetical protein